MAAPVFVIGFGIGGGLGRGLEHVAIVDRAIDVVKEKSTKSSAFCTYYVLCNMCARITYYVCTYYVL